MKAEQISVYPSALDSSINLPSQQGGRISISKPPRKVNYELYLEASNMKKMAKSFRLIKLINPSKAEYDKYVLGRVLNTNQPSVRLYCCSCLYRLGFGYDRMTGHLRLGKGGKKKIASWIKRRKSYGALEKPKLAIKPKLPRPKHIPKYTPEEKADRAVRSLTQKKAKMRLRSYFSQWVNHGLYPRLMPIIVGCDLLQFHHWIESQFTKHMSWDNHGKDWHIDHRIPCRVFDLTKRDNVMRCFHFTNLRPLKAKDNMLKHGKVIPTQPELRIGFFK